MRFNWWVALFIEAATQPYDQKLWQIGTKMSLYSFATPRLNVYANRHERCDRTEFELCYQFC